jgi:beta-mannosidase
MTAPQWPRQQTNTDPFATARTLMRKAQFGFGWDFGPSLPTVGIWRPVVLHRQRRTTIQGVHVATEELSPHHDHARVSVTVDVQRFATDQQLTVTSRSCRPTEISP